MAGHQDDGCSGRHGRTRQQLHRVSTALAIAGSGEIILCRVLGMDGDPSNDVGR